MPTLPQIERGALSRPFFIALAGVVVIAIAISMSLWTRRHDELASSASAPAASHSPAPAKQGAEAPTPPSFDIVRINPQGETVIAGRAMPRAEVVILDGGKEIGRVIADNRGEWVFVPSQPLPPGNRELSLRASNPDGTTSQTDSPVVLVVPERTNGTGPSLAVKIRPDGSIDILQGPEAKEGSGTVSITGARYDSKNRLSLTGTATPKAEVRVYLDDHSLGQVQADAQGRWQLSPKIAIKAGNHNIRADELGADGKVTARAETAFDMSAAALVGDRLTVERGNCLWRIARQIYGSGYEYMTIYQANKDQIRDPNRIYPGQVFSIPGKP